jgi:hypothetical protein
LKSTKWFGVIMDEPQWSLIQSLGRFQVGELSGSCSLDRPAEGVHLALNDHPSSAEMPQLLAPQLPSLDAPVSSGTELFARGGDLVGIYAATQNYPYRSQVYWRLGSHPCLVAGRRALAAIELVVSQQTDLLDTLPVLQVASRMPYCDCGTISLESGEFRGITSELSAGTVVELLAEQGPHVLLVRGESGQPSYAEMVHPLDFMRTELRIFPSASTSDSTHAPLEARHFLFSRPLEKGVILRSRVLGLWLDPRYDHETALTHFRQFADSEPPLTA